MSPRQAVNWQPVQDFIYAAVMFDPRPWRWIGFGGPYTCMMCEIGCSSLLASDRITHILYGNIMSIYMVRLSI